jgi:hypothetical protein
MCTLITCKGTEIDENIANQNHATRTRTPKPGYLKLTIAETLQRLLLLCWAKLQNYVELPCGEAFKTSFFTICRVLLEYSFFS